MASIEVVLEAVKCDEWQKFRLSLKGRSTEAKLQHLRKWLAFEEYRDSCCPLERREVQVLNYLHALARGGQLASGCTLEKLTSGTLKVLK